MYVLLSLLFCALCRAASSSGLVSQCLVLVCVLVFGPAADFSFVHGYRMVYGASFFRCRSLSGLKRVFALCRLLCPAWFVGSADLLGSRLAFSYVRLCVEDGFFKSGAD